MASYNVAIASYPGGEVGIGPSGRMGSEVKRDFGKSLQYGILAGIGAGTPTKDRDIRLGDVVVAYPNGDSPGVVGYDMAKYLQDGNVVLKQWQQATDSALRSAIAKLRAHDDRLEHNFQRHLEKFEKLSQARQELQHFRRPQTPSWNAQFTPLPNGRSLEDKLPRAHYGTILSGNAVIKDEKKRDELAGKFNGAAIEMEAAGLTTQLGVAIIRGVSDFADANKNDDWHAYAALAAAAYAKEMLIKLGPCQTNQKDISPGSSMSISLEVCLSHAVPPVPQHFVGRRAELQELHRFVSSQSQKAEATRLTVYGLAGVGKTQLGSAFVNELRNNDEYDIFWVDGAYKEVFEKSIANILKDSSNAGDGHDQQSSSEQRTIQINSFFSELRGYRRRKWLLVIDSVPSDQKSQDCITEHIQNLINGSVVLITRSRSLRGQTKKSLEVKGLPEDDAVELLKQAAVEQIVDNDQELYELARMFDCHPLTLTIAAPALSSGRSTAAAYVHKFKRRDFEFSLPTEEQKIWHCFDVSFNELNDKYPLAAMLLMLFSYLDHRDLWVDMCKVASKDGSYAPWLQAIAELENPSQLCSQLRSLSFVELKKHGPAGDHTWEIHPVIHELARRKAQSIDEEGYFPHAAVSLVAANMLCPQDNDHRRTARRLVLHAEQCKLYAKQHRAGRPPDSREMKGFGDIYFYLGRLAQASHYYEYSVRYLKQISQKDLAGLELKAGLLKETGIVCHQQGNYDDAVDRLKASLQIYQESWQKDHVTPMTLRHQIGLSLMMQQKLDFAMSSLEEAATFFRTELLGDRSARHHYYRIVNDIGEVHFRKGQVDKAGEAFRVALSGLTELFDEEHASKCQVLLNTGRVDVRSRRFDTAKKTFNSLIKTYMRWWGRRHFETMRAIEELAMAEGQHGLEKRSNGGNGDQELVEAESLMIEVYNFHREVYGENTPSAQFAGDKLHLVMSWKTQGPSGNNKAMYQNSTDMRRAPV